MGSLEGEINYDKFKSEQCYNIGMLTKQHQKYIKQYYLNKGYKIKIRFGYNVETFDADLETKIIVSWKHW